MTTETPEEEVAALEADDASPEQNKDFDASFDAAAAGKAIPKPPEEEVEGKAEADTAKVAEDAKTAELAALEQAVADADTPEAKTAAAKAFTDAGGKTEEAPATPTPEDIAVLEQAVTDAEGDEATAAAQATLDEAKAKVPDENPAATAAEARAAELEKEQAVEAYDRNFAVVKKDRPQIEALVKDQAFFDWIAKQPTAVKEQANMDNPADVIDLVDKYEATQKAGKAPVVGDQGDISTLLDASKDVKIPGAAEGDPQTIGDLRAEVGDNMLVGILTLARQGQDTKTAALEAKIAELEAREYVKPEDLKQMEQEVQQSKLYRDLRLRGHSDAEQLEASPEYKKWVGEASEGMKRLAASWDGRDVALAMGAYKEKTAREAKTPADAAKDTKHKKRTDLHRETSPGGGGGGRSSESDGEDTYEAGFEEAAKQAAAEAKARAG